MRNKISLIIGCVICAVIIAGAYFLTYQKPKDNSVRYKVSADIGGETFHSVVSIGMGSAVSDYCYHGGDYDVWAGDVYVNDQQEAFMTYIFDKCPPNHEMRAILENNIEYVKHEGDCKVFIISPIDKKKYEPSVVYTVDGEMFYQYEKECSLIRRIKKYEAGKITRAEIEDYAQTMKEYEDTLERHRLLYKKVSEDEMNALL